MGSAHAERLEALLAATAPADDAAIKAALLHLAADMRTRLSRSSDSGDFFWSAVAVLGKMRGTANADIRLSCLWDAAQYFYFNGQLVRALTSASALSALANFTASAYWKRRSALMLGVVHADMGNVGDAIMQYSQALDLARVQRDIDGEVSVLGNLGVALNYGALYREAIPCLRAAYELAEQAGLTEHMSRICINLAQSYYYLDRFDEGFSAARISIETFPTPNDVVTSVSGCTREYTYVQIALELGKLAEARKHAKICSGYALKFGSPRAKILADIANGLCEVHGGDVERGLLLLETAVRDSRSIESSRSTALISLVKAYDAANQPDRALVHLRELLEHKRDVRSKSVSALFSLPDDVTKSAYVAGEIDLRSYEFREARLIASVAKQEVVNSRLELLERLAITSDMKEEASGEHGYRVGRIAALFAERLGWDRSHCDSIEIAARLHDLGKLALPDRILLNSLELKEAEREFISAHTIIGAELLAKSNIPQLRMAEEIARHHHEWWNGEGYPTKLAGTRIPIHARIVALADVFDALTHGRPFAAPWPMNKAIEEIRSRKGTQFDPDLTEPFVGLMTQLKTEYHDLDEYLGRAGRNSPFLQARNKIRRLLDEKRETEKIATMEGNETRH